jgi:16S rRNA (cytidine1402-2'-O)-methyltransferase
MVQYSPVSGVLARQSGTLFVVATPIGNLEDITLRALRVLREADIIAAEDTRRTAKLLAHYTVDTRTMSFHAHNVRTRVPQLLSRLQAGESVALVTDAGTPGISDPGVELVTAAVEAGLSVDPVPGVSAPLAAVVASGFPMDPLTILGFAPYRLKALEDWLNDLVSLTSTFTFFETPHRLRRTLATAGHIFGDRPIMLGRELTKLHQEFLHGSFISVLGQLTENRGEFTIVVGPKEKEAKSASHLPSDATIANEFYRVTKTVKVSRRVAVLSVAKTLGCSSRHVYAAVERAKKATDHHNGS